MEEREWYLGQDVHDPNDDTERCDLSVHDRMPVILDAADYDVWLDPGMKNSAGISELLRPFDASAMRCYPVSSRVNNVQNDDAECARPVALETPPQQPLFS